MSVSIRSPRFSFVQFNGNDDFNTCSDTTVSFCLPIFAHDDIAFQFLAVATTEAEAAAMCSEDDAPLRIGLVSDCYNSEFDLEFFYHTAERVRISELEVLFMWPHGVPGFTVPYAVGDCFYIKVLLDHPTAGEISGCSNCFERIAQNCWTSVLEYGGTENQFEFNYCGSGSLFGDTEDQEPCAEPMIIQFNNVATIDEPYTPGMLAAFGQVPTVQIFIQDGGEYVLTNIRAGFDAYPPTRIIADLGGLATGFIKIS